MTTGTTAGAPRHEVPAEWPSFGELTERAYAVVAAASPLHPTRSRVEWLVGERERGARAIDALLAGGFLKVDGSERLMLGERRRAVRLLSTKRLTDKRTPRV